MLSPCKMELQLGVACREARAELRHISATETVQGLLHNYQLFDPLSCSRSRDNIRRGRENFPADPMTNGRMEAKFPQP